MSTSSMPNGSGWREPTAAEIEKHVDLYEIVYEEAKRTLDDQAAELANMRTRSVQFLALVGSASGFLIGAGIHPAHRGMTFYVVACFATVVAFATLLIMGLLLAPWMTPLKHRVRPAFVMERWIERDLPAPSKGAMLRELALHFDDWRMTNKDLLRRAHFLYISIVVLGGVQLLAWAMLVWKDA